MKQPVPWRLLFAHLRRSWFRTTLTAAGVALAIFLLVLLQTVITELQSGVKYAGRSRLITTSAVSLFVNLPEKLHQGIEGVPGVVAVTHWTWFGGVYIDDKNMFARFAVDPPTMRRVYGDLSAKKEIVLSTPEWEAFESDRRGCIVGAALARQFGFKVGDRIPLKGNIWPGDYEFTVCGVYSRGSPQIDESTMFFHWKYLDETVGRRSVVSIFVAELDPEFDAGRITNEIDALFESSENRTRTQTEAAFNQSFVSMWGNVPALLGMIGGAVLFAAFMIALNTMLLNARDRRSETGVLKALGYPDRAIFLLNVSEGIVVCTIGGAAGAFAGWFIFNHIGVDALGRFFPSFIITDETFAFAVGTSVIVGLVAGIVPAVILARIRVIDALSRFG
ncbi:MAG: ABC transporter permease [Planctomycetes bacterium]|nr:ABC transporter permease [Planctomycetota bacterium]